jgi:hypothetical protein
VNPQLIFAIQIIHPGSAWNHGTVNDHGVSRAQRDPQWGDGFPSPSIMGWGYQLDIFHQISSDFIRFHQIIIDPNMEFSGFSATYIGIGDN